MSAATTLAVSDQPSVAQPDQRKSAACPSTPPRRRPDPARSSRWRIARDGWEGSCDRGLGAGPCRADRKKSPVPELVSLQADFLAHRFTLIDIRSVKPLHEGPIPTPAHAGVQSLNLKDLGLALEPDVQYRWYISAIRNPDSPSQDIVAGGVIERCEFSTCLVEMEVDLSCDRQSVLRNAVRGFWYDAMACLCDLIKTDQQDASLRRIRAALLKQVGLNGVAEWDLKSVPPLK